MSEALNARRLQASTRTVFDQMVPRLALPPLPPEVAVRWPRMVQWLDESNRALESFQNELQNRLGSTPLSGPEV